MANAIVPTILVTGSTASGKSSFVNTLKHLTAQRKDVIGNGELDHERDQLHIVELRDDQVETWVRGHKPRRHILCIYLLKPSDFPLLQPPTTAFDTLLRLRALARPDSPSASPAHRTSTSFKDRSTNSPQRRRGYKSGGTLVVLPVLSKADSYTTTGLERARKECLNALRDDWEEEDSLKWDWGFLSSPTKSNEASTSSPTLDQAPLAHSQRQKEDGDANEEGEGEKSPKEIIWGIINPDWNEPSLQSKMKIKVLRMDGLPPTPPSRCDSLPAEAEKSVGVSSTSQSAIAGASDLDTVTEIESVSISPRRTRRRPGPSSNGEIVRPYRVGSSIPAESSLDGSRAASIPSSSGTVTSSKKKGKGKEMIVSSSTLSDSSKEVVKREEKSEKEELSETYVREYPWGKCYPLKPSHSDLSNVIKWTVEKMDELSKQPVLDRGDMDLDDMHSPTSALNAPHAVDEEMQEHDQEMEGNCVHSPCMLSNCSGDHHGDCDFDYDDEREDQLQLRRSVSTNAKPKEAEMSDAQKLTTGLEGVRLQGRRASSSMAPQIPSTPNTVCLASSTTSAELISSIKSQSITQPLSHPNIIQVQAHEPQSPVVSTPTGASTYSGTGPSTLLHNRRSRTPHPLSLPLDPENLPNGPPPPPMLSPSGRRWPGAPASTTGLADDSYPNSHPRSSFKDEITSDWRSNPKARPLRLHTQFVNAQNGTIEGCRSPLKPEERKFGYNTPQPGPSSINNVIATPKPENATPTLRSNNSPSGTSTGSVYSHIHTHPLSNRIIALDPITPPPPEGSLRVHALGPPAQALSGPNAQVIPQPQHSHPHLHPQQALKPQKPRKPKAQLACTFCRTRKLRCAPSASSTKVCGECEKRQIVCEGPSEREVRKKREMEELQAAQAAGVPVRYDPKSVWGSNAATPSKEPSNEGKIPSNQVTQPKTGEEDQTPYITGQLTDLGVIIPKNEASGIRGEGNPRRRNSFDRDGDGQTMDTARNERDRKMLGPGQGSSKPIPNATVDQSETRTPQVVVGSPDVHHHRYFPPALQSSHSSRQPPSLFLPIQPKHMSQQTDRGASPPPHVRRPSFERGPSSDREVQSHQRIREEETHQYYSSSARDRSRDRTPSRGYHNERELPPLSRSYYGPSSAEHRELQTHRHVHAQPPSRYRARDSSPPPPHRQPGFTRRMPSPPPGSLSRPMSLSHHGQHHYSQHPPAVPSQPAPGSLQPHGPTYAHRASLPHVQHTHIVHGRSHSLSHPGTHSYMPPLMGQPPLALARDPLPNQLPPLPGSYAHMQARPRGSISDDFSIANMNMRTRKAKEEVRQRNPSSRSGPKVVACNHCRARKTRCDGETPCSNCHKRNLTCQYQISAREAARRKRAQAADLASRERSQAGPSSVHDSPQSLAPTQASPVHSRSSSIEAIEPGSFGSGSPGSIPFSHSYRHGASASPVLHRPQPPPSTSPSMPIHLAPVASQQASHSPRTSLPPITSLTSPPPSRSETIHPAVESLKRPRSPAQLEVGNGSPTAPSAPSETSQSRSKRMRVETLID